MQNTFSENLIAREITVSKVVADEAHCQQQLPPEQALILSASEYRRDEILERLEEIELTRAHHWYLLLAYIKRNPA